MSFSAATATPTERATAALLLLMLFSSSTTNAYSDKGSTHQGHARAQEKIRDITSRHLPLKTRNCEPCGAPRRVYKSSNDPVGRKHEFRIVGGRKSMQSRPWMVFVLILRDNRCSGSLLNERYVLTAAHCVCTHFFCGTDDNGRRISNFKPRTDIRVYLGLKDLRFIFHGDHHYRLTANEYLVDKITVHPKYNDALYDLALMRTDRHVAFSRRVQPICLPFGSHFPDIRTDAVVAGWGTLKNTICHTNDDGPKPNSQCAFPFKRGSVVHHECEFGPNPSEKDPLCKEFREKFPSALAHAKSEVLLYEVDDAGDVGTTPTRTCYAPHSGANGWCATCALISDDPEENVCTPEERWNPAKVSADKNWGWCNKLCSDNQELLPHHLQEVSLVVFPPDKCERLLNDTGAPFGADTELCAGYIVRRRRKHFLFSKKGSKTLFQEMDMDYKFEFDMIGGKDACTGDSGAPLWIEMGRRRRRAFIVGVVSRGFNCASHNLPGIYVRVKKFLDWIIDVMGVNDGQCGTGKIGVK